MVRSFAELMVEFLNFRSRFWFWSAQFLSNFPSLATEFVIKKTICLHCAQPPVLNFGSCSKLFEGVYQTILIHLFCSWTKPFSVRGRKSVRSDDICRSGVRYHRSWGDQSDACSTVIHFEEKRKERQCGLPHRAAYSCSLESKHA